ncbi:MAG: diaminopimelate epimerase [Bacteroidetes bacterium QH_7_62_13]|nr:MAG: diaminopimelate epimerase [Bacteroidetes bacterium QH_7_62_13]
MSPSLVVEFSKMHGAGNDFIVIDNRWYRFSDAELADLAETWCPRRFGVGADGLLALNEAESDDVAYRMRYVNADGSWATMCGNGARCLAQFALESDFEGPELSFETDAGRYHATRAGEAPDRVRLFVPPPEALDLDMIVDADTPEPVHFVHTGTEHLVTFVPDIRAVSVEEWAPPLRADPRVHPEGANVNFVAVNAEGSLQVRTYEKGVEEETLSCGTGVLAAAVVAGATDRVDDGPVTVHTRGGTLQVGTAATSRGRERYLEGPVVNVFRGSLKLE